MAIPNLASASFQSQASPDAADIEILEAGYRGTGVVSGCAVTAQGTPDGTVAVASGTAMKAGIPFALTGANVTVTPHATLAQRHIIVHSVGVGLTALAGTASAEPVLQLSPVTGLSDNNVVPLASVYTEPADTAIVAGQITDKRVFVKRYLDDLADVTITSVATGQFLAWNGTAYVNTTPGYNESLLLVTPGSSASINWTVPSVAQEFANVTRFRVKRDLTNMTHVRVVVRVLTGGGFVGTVVGGQYSTDESTWASLDGAFGPFVAVDSSGTKASSWVALTGAAKADVLLRITGAGGNDSATTAFGNAYLEFKRA